MKVEDSTRMPVPGLELRYFEREACVRLVSASAVDEPFANSLYVVCDVGCARYAVNLETGNHRINGQYVLVPGAKVVIE